MANLEECTPEENLMNKKKLFNFLKLLIKNFPNLILYYKNFDGNFKDDWINDYLEEEITNKKIIFSNKRATLSMNHVNFVIFDNVSTGFAESISMNIPSIIFNNQYDYDAASPLGKEINDLLYQNEILFYDEKEGINIIKKMLPDISKFNESKIDIYKRFQDLICYPISKLEFISRLNTKLK